MPENKTYVFGSKHAGYMLVLDTGGPRMVNGMYVPKMPFRGVTFSNGIYKTSNEEEAQAMMAQPSYKVDFWEITKPEDAKGVNLGRTLEVSSGVKATFSTPQRK